ncbi:hypothetical protein ACIBP6_28095 [Nonomuraea terrae]|uniref:hypothetical protein n=1 Tax=Nonomuraea terrae TaxID=2530383 RepID=UPI0037B5D646
MTRWTINPETLSLDPEVGDASISRLFAGEEWRAQEWPPCPACGRTIHVTTIDAQTSQDPHPM